MKQGLKPGSGQACASYKNINPLEKSQTVSNGIYSSNSVSMAQGYIKDSYHSCIIQCKIFLPKTRIPLNRSDFFVTSTENIIPYRILLKKR
jgi:hypothetical protein